MIRPDEVFTFGSNIAGRHGKGAALDALRLYGAIRGQGVGLQGRSYAIPTKDAALRDLPLPAIDQHIGEFIEFAKAHPELKFYVTPVGCGLRGLKQAQVLPLFKDMPSNCRFASTWDHVANWLHGEHEPGEHQEVIDALNGVSDDGD